MRVLKAALKAAFWLLIFALLVLPLGLIYQISEAEMEAYAPPESPIIREVSIGTPYQARRMDVRESVEVSGTFTSKEVAFVELDYRYPAEIHWIVSAGEEIQQGQTLGWYRDEPVISEVDGILEEISTYNASDAYLKIRCFAPLILECKVDDKVLSALKRGGEDLTLAGDIKVELIYAAKAKNENGTTTVQLKLDSEKYSYGESLEDLVIYTGGGYPNVLTLDADCVYQKEAGEDEPWYARQVTEDGYFIAEIQLRVGYSDGSVVCVSGISEGDYFDPGYKAIVEGDSK